MDNASTAKVVMDGIQGTTGLILNKLDELIKATAGQINSYYPYVVKQQFILGIAQLIAVIFGLVALVGGLVICYKLNQEGEDADLGASIALIGGIFFLISLITFLSSGLGQLLNPNYFAVQDIINIGKNLISH